MSRRGGLILIVAAALLAAPAGADATPVIFGADLTQSVTVGPACSSSTGQHCSVVTVTRTDGFGERGSPIDGVLTSARVKTVGGATTVDVRVLRPDPVLLYNYLNVGPETPIPVPDVSPSSTGVISEVTGLHHPIAAHDRLGIGWIQGSTPLNYGVVGGGSACAFRQQPADSGDHPVDTTVQYNNAGCLFEILVQGTVETDADHDGFGDDTQDQCPTDASTHGPCPTTAPPPPHKKKCKKKKHRAAETAKKKKCKKKRR